MSVPGLLVALLLAAIAIAVVARPLLLPARQERLEEIQSRRQRDRLRESYERVLTNIRDLDEDQATGKANDADYRAEREVLLRRGIELLRLQDELERERSAMLSARVDEAIEAALPADHAGDGQT